MPRDSGWLLMAPERKRAERMTHGRATDFLAELADSDTEFALAARKAIYCVEEFNADPRMLAVLLERCMDGFFQPHGSASTRVPSGRTG